MGPLVLPIVNAVTSIVDKLIPDPQKKAEIQLETLKLAQAGEFKEIEAELAKTVGQLEINKIEAASPNVFVAGWRPAIGWICAFALAYQLILRPIGGWIMESWLGWKIPPTLELETLMTLLFGMLGLGTFRTIEKVKGKA